MFDLIVDAAILDQREYAKKGNLHAIFDLATSLSRGRGTKQDKDKALRLINHLIEQGDALQPQQLRWNAMIEKANILNEQGDLKTSDQLMVTIVQEMSRQHPSKWEIQQMMRCLEWLQIRQQEDGEDFGHVS